MFITTPAKCTGPALCRRCLKEGSWHIIYIYIDFLKFQRSSHFLKLFPLPKMNPRPFHTKNQHTSSMIYNDLHMHGVFWFLQQPSHLPSLKPTSYNYSRPSRAYLPWRSGGRNIWPGSIKHRQIPARQRHARSLIFDDTLNDGSFRVWDSWNWGWCFRMF